MMWARWQPVAVFVCAAVSWAGQARAQAALADDVIALTGGEEAHPTASTSLGPTPGAMGTPGRHSPGTSQFFLGGRPGAEFAPVPSSLTRPATASTLVSPGPHLLSQAERLHIEPIPRTTILQPPAYNPLELPGGPDDLGPETAMNLDRAIDRLLHENLELRARYFEIPMAEAEMLTASLRENPIIFTDAADVPYGKFSPGRPESNLYDVSLILPVDITRKRQAEMRVAHRARNVLQAQYQEAVRQEIDNLYTAFVDVLAARETTRYARASVDGLSAMLRECERRYHEGKCPIDEYESMQSERSIAEIGWIDAVEQLRRARRELATILNIPPEQADDFPINGTVREQGPPLPSMDELFRLALAHRPDLAAYELGVKRAQADVKLAQASRFSDVFLFYEPYTFINNSYIDRKSATAWALGVMTPLPLFNRNQGNIARAKWNVDRTQAELIARQRRVLTEVQQAAHAYDNANDNLLRIERALMPTVRSRRNRAWERYQAGLADASIYLGAQRDYNSLVRLYRDTAVRHRRSMLELNTAVGVRLMP